MDIQKVLESGNVERFHQAVGVSKQKLSEHQWGVAILLMKFFPDCRKQVITLALTHDASELYTGDVPATAKWANPELKILLDDLEDRFNYELDLETVNISAHEKRMLKLCDCLEGMSYCAYRYECGEKLASRPFYAWMGFLTNKFNNMLIGDVKRYFDSLVERVIE